MLFYSSIGNLAIYFHTFSSIYPSNDITRKRITKINTPHFHALHLESIYPAFDFAFVLSTDFFMSLFGDISRLVAILFN